VVFGYWREGNEEGMSERFLGAGEERLEWYTQFSKDFPIFLSGTLHVAQTLTSLI
jgi:hypothetical protein